MVGDPLRMEFRIEEQKGVEERQVERSEGYHLETYNSRIGEIS